MDIVCFASSGHRKPGLFREISFVERMAHCTETAFSSSCFFETTSHNNCGIAFPDSSSLSGSCWSDSGSSPVANKSTFGVAGPLSPDDLSGVFSCPSPSTTATTASSHPPQQTASLINGGSNTSNNAKRKPSKKSSGKSSYKHVPHREKPPHLVARRNARERRRVQAVNSAFARLRKCVPFENRSKRLSKVKTLHRAIEYIHSLQEMLSEADAEMSSQHPCPDSTMHPLEEFLHHSASSVGNKENDENQRWISLGDSACSQENYANYLSYYDDYSRVLDN